MGRSPRSPDAARWSMAVGGGRPADPYDGVEPPVGVVLSAPLALSPESSKGTTLDTWYLVKSGLRNKWACRELTCIGHRCVQIGHGGGKVLNC